MSQPQSYVPLVEVTRGFEIESAHAGAVAVVDSGGHLVASIGHPSQPVYLRSCAKPFQAMAFLCSGAADAIGASEEELAVVCASHSGEPEHVALVESLLRKSGLSPKHLQCGAHPPLDREARERLRSDGEEPSALHNNCSGKHAAMLATARHLDLPVENYTDPEHGVQLAILGLLASLCGVEPDEIGVSIDGCSAPVFYLPLRSFSLALARLAEQGQGSNAWLRRTNMAGDPDLDIEDLHEELEDAAHEELLSFGEDFPVSIPDALTRVWQAMTRHPYLVAGSSARICTDLMRVAQQFGVPLIAKSGAEGTYAIAAFHEGAGIGITVKIEDGAQRARDAAVVETLLQLGVFPDEARGPLVGYHRQLVQTICGEPVGEVRTCFRLNRGLPR